MATVREISEAVVAIVVDDLITEHFEGIWPIPDGITYNSYVVLGEKKALIEAGAKEQLAGDFLRALASVVDPMELDYIVVNHSEPDHTGSLPALLKMTEAEVVASKFGASLLEKFYGIGGGRVRVVGDGDSLDLGGVELTFYAVPGVHWPDSMVTYLRGEKILFSSDIFGSFGALRGKIFDSEVERVRFLSEAKRYFVNIMGGLLGNVRRVWPKISRLDAEVIAPAHGPIWRAHKEDILQLYSTIIEGKERRKVVILYGSMYGFTRELAYLIAGELASNGVEVELFDASRTHPSYTLASVWDAAVVVIGGPTYDNGAFPPLLNHVSFFKIKKIKGKKYALFGSSGWAGGGYRELKAVLDGLGWEMISSPLEFRGRADESVRREANGMVREILRALEARG